MLTIPLYLFFFLYLAFLTLFFVFFFVILYHLTMNAAMTLTSFLLSCLLFGAGLLITYLTMTTLSGVEWNSALLTLDFAKWLAFFGL